MLEARWEPWQKILIVALLIIANLVVWLDAFDAAHELRVSLGVLLLSAVGWAGITRSP